MKFTSEDFLICAAEEVSLKIYQFNIKIRIKLIIVNNMNWLVIQCGNLKDGCMGMPG
jgi:hypothetical protein